MTGWDRLVDVAGDAAEAYKHWVDVAASIDVELLRVGTSSDLRGIAEFVDSELRSADDKEIGHLLDELLAQSGRPDGPHGHGPADRAFLAAIARRARTIDELARLGPLLARDDGMAPLRATHFIDDDTGMRVLTAMWDRHRPEFDAMYNKRNGLQRMHFYADLADEVGTTGMVSAHGGHSAEDQHVSEVTGAVLVIDWNRFERSYEVVSCHPEIVLDVDLRHEYPSLVQFFGTAFRQSKYAPAFEVVRRMEELKNPAYDRTRDELDRLLALDDQRITDVITACGSYVLPRAVRHWVHCLRRRFDEFDWQPDKKGRFA